MLLLAAAERRLLSPITLCFWQSLHVTSSSKHHCRQCDSGWAITPQNLMDVIMGKFEERGGTKALAPIRAVSRAWRDAFTAYPAQLTRVVLKQHDDISKLVKIVPSMSSLALSSITESPDLKPLGACSQLSSLCICQYQHGEGATVAQRSTYQSDYVIDLSHLPPNLQSLKVAKVRAQLTYSGPVNLRRLTKVIWRAHRPQVKELCDGLQLLPQLKVGIACIFLRSFSRPQNPIALAAHAFRISPEKMDFQLQHY